MIRIDSHTLIDPGARDHNEDDLRVGQAGTCAWAVLSDGAGGHSAGDEASRRVVTTLDLRLGEASARGGLDPQVLESAIQQAHAALNQDQSHLHGRQRMHATVVALWVDLARSQAIWAHVGDSRLYLVRGGVATPLTRDDSVVQQMVDAGFLSAQDALHHPRKNQLLSALGGPDAIDVHVATTPLDVVAGDAFLLCSDGWWDVVQPPSIAQTLAVSGDARDWLERMVTQVVAHGSEQQDNYSAVCWRLG